MRREAEKGRGAHATARADLLSWTPRKALDQMDANQIQTAIGSISTPGIWFGDAKESGELARGWNDYAAELVTTYPRRFGYFATIPLPATDVALTEVQYALDQLHADGVALFTNYDGKYLGDQDFVEVLAELNRRATIVYVHPIAPAYGRPIPELLPQVIEFAFETTRAITSLLVNGRFLEFPNINWVFSHSGGCIPMLAGRLDHLLQRPQYEEKIPGGPRLYLQRLFFDVAGAGSPGAIAALRSLLPPEQILYGSDAPFVSAQKGLQELAESTFSPDEWALIGRANAMRLIPRLASLGDKTCA